MNSSLISIIIPVYNVDKYLCQCLDSILSQSYSEWECLLIDDGSKDLSSSICDEYALKDSRFRVFHKENGGVSSARNFGLDNAKGDWITFCDSDDLLLENALFEYSKFFYDEVDVIKSGFAMTGRSSMHKTIMSTKEIRLEDKSQILELCELSHYCGFLWNSCFRRSVIDNERFIEDISWCEDHIFTYTIISKAQSVQFISYIAYNYYVEDDAKEGKGKGLSKKILNPQMVIDAALKEKGVKCLLAQNNKQLIRLIDLDFINKINKASYYALIKDGVLSAFSVAIENSPNKLSSIVYVIKQMLKSAIR